MATEKYSNKCITKEVVNYVSVRIPLSSDEEKRFDEYVAQKGLKKGAFIANLIQTAIKGVRDV